MSTTAETEAMLVELLGDHLEQFRADLERMVAAKPLPPFVPPPLWQPGRHGAGIVVRHRNGMFYARRDTDEEPPSDAWLPLLVGIATVGVEWPTDRTMALRVELSDGAVIVTEQDFVVPLARGFWKADESYLEGDRVVRFGDWQAVKASIGIDPNTEANDGHWIKVGGRQSRAAFNFKIDDEGTLYENGHAIGSLKPVIAGLLRDHGLVPST